MSGAFIFIDMLMIDSISPLGGPITMYKCKFCRSVMPDYASFCGQCGRTPDKVMKTRTMASSLHMQDVQDTKTVSNASVPGNYTPDWAYNQQTYYNDTPTISLSQEEEEEERRRRAAVLGIGCATIRRSGCRGSA